MEHNVQNDEGICTMQWILLGATSTVTLLASLAFRDQSVDNIIVYGGKFNETLLSNGTDLGSLFNKTGGVSICEAFDEVDCGRVNLAIISGSVSAAVSIVIAPWKNSPAVCQAEAAMLLLIMWTCGVIFITFGTGPGTVMSTIYFATWASFFLSLNIVTKTMGMHIDKPNQEPAEPDTIGEEFALDDSDAHTNTAENQKIYTVDADEQTSKASKKPDNNSSRPRVRRRTDVTTRGEIFETAYAQLNVRRNPSTSDLRRQYTGGSMFESVLENTVVYDAARSPKTPMSADMSDGKHRIEQLQHWVALLVSSTVCLCSVFPSLPESSSRTTNDVIAIIVASASIGLSCLGYLCCVRATKVARSVEVLLTCGCAFAWAFGMRFIFSAAYRRYDLSNETISTVEKEDPNVFFSTWACLVISLVLIARWLKLSVISTDWFLLSCFSFALMGTSLIHYHETITISNGDGSEVEVRKCQIRDVTDCDRVQASAWFGLASGALAIVICLMTVFVIPKLDQFFFMTILHVVVAFLFLLLWISGVGIVAYGTGHGSRAGSAYLQVWACVFLALDVATTNMVVLIKEWKARNKDIDTSHEPASDDVIYEGSRVVEEANGRPESVEAAN